MNSIRSSNDTVTCIVFHKQDITRAEKKLAETALDLETVKELIPEMNIHLSASGISITCGVTGVMG